MGEVSRALRQVLDAVGRIDEPEQPEVVEGRERALLYEAHGILRRVERYGDWDAEYHVDACELKRRLDDFLWPDEEIRPDLHKNP